MLAGARAPVPLSVRDPASSLRMLFCLISFCCNELYCLVWCFFFTFGFDLKL